MVMGMIIVIGTFMVAPAKFIRGAALTICELIIDNTDIDSSANINDIEINCIKDGIIIYSILYGLAVDLCCQPMHHKRKRRKFCNPHFVDPLLEPELVDGLLVDGGLVDVEGGGEVDVDGGLVDEDGGVEVDVEGALVDVEGGDKALVVDDSGLVVVVVVDGEVDANVGVGLERLTLIGLNVV